MQRLFTFLFVIITAFTAHAQNAGEVNAVSVEGFITNPAGQHIENVNVVNLSRQTGTTTNKDGQFKIYAYLGNKIKFSCLGYLDEYFSVPEQKTSPVIPVHLILKPDTVVMSEIDIYPWPATGKELKRDILSMKPEGSAYGNLHLNDYTHMKMSSIPGYPKVNAPGIFAPFPSLLIKSPVTAVYNVFSKRVKEQRQYVALLQADARKATVAQKLNYELIKKVTHFTTDVEIKDFLNFCNLTDEFVLRSSEYELLAALDKYFQEYRKK